MVGICGWYLQKRRELNLAVVRYKSSCCRRYCPAYCWRLIPDTALHRKVAKHQPMKLAAMERLYRGGSQADLEAIGVLRPDKQYDDKEDPFLFKIDVPFKGFCRGCRLGRQMLLYPA